MPDLGRSKPHIAAQDAPPPSKWAELGARLASRAKRQHGVIARDQLEAIGLGRHEIQRLLDTERLVVVHRGVYAIGGQRLLQRGTWFAALLATRPDPLLSHLSSAAETGLARERGAVHVTVAGRGGRRLTGVVVHRCRSIDPDDRTRSENDLPITTISRTLLDIAETEPFDQLRSIVETAERRELLDFDALRACMDRNPGRRGLAPLDRLLREHLPVDGANEGLEREFQRFLADYGLPTPQCNVLVAGLLVDFYWPEVRLVVELDSREYHAHWEAAERDRRRDAKLLREGIPVLRVTSRRLHEDRDELAKDIWAPIER